MEQSHDQPTNAAPAASFASPLVLGFIGLAGMIAWAVHFWTVFSLVAIACRTTFPNFSLGGLSGLQVLLGVVTVVAGLVVLAAILAAWRVRRRAADAAARGRNGPRALADYLAESGLLLSGFFLAAIVLAAVPAFTLAPCE